MDIVTTPLIRINGVVLPGNSGGPLLCVCGLVHGMVIASEGGSAVAYAVPASVIRASIQDYRRKSKHVSVTMITAPWCPACAHAEKWMTEHRIPFKKQVYPDFDAISRAVGGDVDGIPLFIINGPANRRRFTGFSADGFTKAYRECGGQIPPVR